ncbi:Trappc2 [Scenedesmus sp. PABB004]|nr:Trappc2 [Scenedesmus sp. PABB004]
MAAVAGGVLTFVIVGQQDQPIYEVDLTGPKEVRGASARRRARRRRAAALTRSRARALARRPPRAAAAQQQTQYLHQFVLHASLDAVDEAMWASKELHLKTVDRFNNLFVSAYVTPGGARLLLLHDGRGDDAIRAFFAEVAELHLRVMLNPFHGPATRITSKPFDQKVKALAKRMLG